MRNLQEQFKKHSVTKNCSDLSLYQQIVLVMEKKLLRFEAEGQEFANIFLNLKSLEQFLLTVGQNNSGNKIPFLVKIKYYYIVVFCMYFD